MDQKQGTSPGRLLSGSLNTSHDSLVAHPLLSPALPGLATISSNADTSGPKYASPSVPRYVPYTPRHRIATSATTGATMHASVSPQHHLPQGDATSKLQLMNLKAAAQNIGLDTASLGWIMLEQLGTEVDLGPEWIDVWNTITTARATLLLPLEHQSSDEPLTVEFFKDHIAFCDISSPQDANIVTLSGLRGTLENGNLIFRSSLHPTSKTYQALLLPSTRNATFASLPPLPRHKALPSSYPTFPVSSYTPSLPLLPRSPVAKPPLPPRPAFRTPSQSSSGHPATRLPNPFASLFGRSTASPPASPTTTISPLHSVSVSTVNTGFPELPGTNGAPRQSDVEHSIDVPAFVISRPIIRKDVRKSLLHALRAEIKQSLSSVPTWVIDRVEDFTATLCPVVRVSSSQIGQSPGTITANGSIRSRTFPSSSITYLPNPLPNESMDEISQTFQTFYADLEQHLQKHVSSDRHHDPQVSSSAEGTSDEKERQPEVIIPEQSDKECQVRNILEVVERIICSLFYDRLFMQPTSDDASHDEALSSRIAAVNLLDLGLGNLGVDVGNVGPDVEALTIACGETLGLLDQCHTPADKAGILVKAHKLIVDGLSKLPPISLKSEQDMTLDEKTPQVSTFGNLSRGGKSDDISSTPSATDQGDNVYNDTSMPSRSDTTSTVTSLSSQQQTSVSVEHAPAISPTPVSGDLILPLMIYAVVKSNPPRLVSHLLYTQRFRNESVGGEESYCLINVMAVAEFLENVDLAALGLGESESTLMSTAALTPIRLTQPPSPRSTANASLRGRVEQQVDAIAGSANKVISGVVDSSFGVLRSFLPGNDQRAETTPEIQESAPWNASRASFGLLRRDTGFSIASLTASLPGGRIKPAGGEEVGQQMIEVPSRPGSSRSMHVEDGVVSSESSDENDDEDESDYEDEDEHDARSIRSFESMMSSKRRKGKKRTASGRKSITDRLASVPGLSRLSQSHDAVKGSRHYSPPMSRRSSLLAVPGPSTRPDTPISSRVESPIMIRISPPNPRFLSCTEDDLRVSEVGELLREYKRLVEAVRVMGGFLDD